MAENVKSTQVLEEGNIEMVVKKYFLYFVGSVHYEAICPYLLCLCLSITTT